VRRIAICTPDVDTGDAVSNDVLGMLDACVDEGYEAKVFASNTNVNKPEVLGIDLVKDFLKDPDDVLIYHHSVGWDVGISLLRELDCRKVIKYHNVTPPHFFEGLARNYIVACESGREQLKDITSLKADLYLADSEYNMNELLELDGTLHHAVVPPFHHIDRLKRLEADPSVLRDFNDGRANIVTVGRIAPNKGHPALIDTFYIYYHNYNKDSRLIIVGKEDPGLTFYTADLRLRVERLGLRDSVFFTGKVSDRALKAYYVSARAFLLTSLHEGFCVPLVEAMSMKVPVVAYGSSAVPWTMGKAGLVWNECDPELLAVSLNRILGDGTLRLHLMGEGLRRYGEMFTREKIRERFMSVLRGILIKREDTA